MGFGSGGGGFTPSPNNVPGSTTTGTDKDTDTHQFTGSVDITGSLTLNGSSITGGGGGGTPGGSDTQVQYNDAGSFAGSANLVFDGTSLTATQMTASTSMKAAALQVSSSAEGALFRVDHATQSGAKPILFITGSGLVGIGTDAPRADSADTNRVHILGESGADQGQDPVDNTVLMLENNSHAAMQFMTPNNQAGIIAWGSPSIPRQANLYYGISGNRYHFEGAGFGSANVMTILASGNSVNIGQSQAAHMNSSTACLAISSSTGGTDIGGPVLLKVDHADQPGAKPILFVTGSGRVGIGTDTPTALLHVSSSTSEDLFRVDHEDHTDNPIFVITGSGQVGIGIGTPTAGTVLDVDPDNGAGSNSVRFKGSAQATLFHYSTGEHIYLRGGKTTSTIFIADARTGNGSSNQKTIIGNATSTSAKLHVSSSDNPTVMTVTSNNGSILTALENQRVGIGTDTPVQTLSVSGSAAFSGAFGSTAIETLAANGTISANTGLTLVDASSSLAVNNTLLFSIADGTFAGQEKKIRGLIISGSDGTNSTGIYIVGTNIDSPPSLGGNGQIVLSSSNPAAGPSFERAGCSLVWDGSKWLAVGNYNFNINNTGF